MVSWLLLLSANLMCLMRMISLGRRLAICLFGLAAGWLQVQAATLSISPTSISALYQGNITLQIGGITSGDTVLVQRFLDLNGNGVVDAGEPLVQSFRVTDGQVTSIGGARDNDIPGDNDLTANGQITATVNFANGPEFSRASGSYIYRVSSPTLSFSPVQQSLTVTQASYPQQITGTVLSGGTPLTNAMVGLLIQVGNNSEFIAGTAADASGNFSLAVSNGTYVVAAFKAGYVGNFASSPMVAVSGANTNVTVSLTAPSLTISGSVNDASNSVPLPGLQFFVTGTNNEYLVLFPDASGNFSVNVTPGQWKFEPSDYSLTLAGYFRSSNKPKIDVGSVNVSGLTIPLFKGTAMIYGTLKDDQNRPLGGVLLNSSDNGGLYECNATTDTNGNFYVVGTAATWNVGPSIDQSGLPPSYILPNVQITLAIGQAVQTNLVAHQASAWLVGHATDSNSNPIGGGSILGFGTNNQFISAQLAGDGSFALPLTGGGAWSISLENGTAASYNVVAPSFNFNVSSGVSVSNIAYVAPIATRTISGSVKTAGGIGITSLNVFSGAVINGTNYVAGGNTDGGGNYSLPVLAGSWNVTLDSQGLAQRGYGSPPGQVANTTSGNQTVNFVVGAAPMGSLFFRHSLGAVGEFGNRATPTVVFPVNIKNYRAIYFRTDTNPPNSNLVLFTGPPGSGLTNTPADPAFGAVQDGSTVYYFSPPVRNPSIAMGGTWTINYNTNINYLTVPDPQAGSRITVPLPTINTQNGLLRSVTWSYRDQFGNSLGGAPPYVVTNRIDLFDQNGNGIDAEVFPSTYSYTYPATNLFPWADISVLRIDYIDNMTNQYFVAFSESLPTLTGATFVPGHGCQFLLNGTPGQNFTIQYSTNLVRSNWVTLYVTNGLTSPISVADPGPAGPARFYRVLVGP